MKNLSILKLAIFSVAFMLIFSLAQCKKEQPQTQTQTEPVTPPNPGGNDIETVHITVHVDSICSKVYIYSTGQIRFNSGDKLYVGYNGAKVNGMLSYDDNNNVFSGNLVINQDGDDKPLSFYYMGGKVATMVDATHYSVDINDQASGYEYPLIACGTSTQPYTGAGDYNTALQYKSAVVKFLTNVYEGTVNIDGMNSVATVGFETGEITAGTPGTISFTTNDHGMGWAILLEQDAVNGAAVSSDGFNDDSCDVPEITCGYHTDGINMTLQLAVTNTHEFSINDNGGKVYFSKGNLYGKHGAYYFGENKYDIGNHYDFAYTNEVSGWRALSKEEWEYLFNRDNMRKWGYALYDGDPGIIILPDDYDGPEIYYIHTEWSDNELSEEDWPWTSMQEHGAVFLPAENEGFDYSIGRYWTSTPFGSEGAYRLEFGDRTEPGMQYPQCFNTFADQLYLLRLVKDVFASK